MYDQWRARSPHYDDTHEAVADTVRAFVAREIMPHVAKWEAAGELPRELHRKAAEAGVLGLGFCRPVSVLMRRASPAFKVVLWFSLSPVLFTLTTPSRTLT